MRPPPEPRDEPTGPGRGAPAAKPAAPRAGPPRPARLRIRVHALAASLLVVAIAGMLNYLAARTYVRWDWTSEGFFTLSDRAVEELRALSEPVVLHLFVSRGEPKFDELQEILERARAHSEHLDVRYVDPDRDPAAYRLLVERLELRDAASDLMEIAAVLEAGERRFTITRDDLVGYDFGDVGEGPTVSVQAEQALIGALVDVTQGEPTQVCLSTGHGEWSIDPSDERSLSALEGELRNENVDLRALPTLRRDVPEDCDALFVLGPLAPFTEDEAERVGRYLRAGGNALVAIDPILQGERPVSTGLEPLLEGFGVRVDQSIVLETSPDRLLPPGAPTGPFGVVAWGEHPLVAQAATLRMELVVFLARSVRPEPGGGAQVLFSTSDASWAETDLGGLGPEWLPERDDADVPGPVPLAVATTVAAAGAPPAGEADPEAGGEGDARASAESRGRLVVVGDSDFLDGALIRNDRFGNRRLARFLTGWLTSRRTLISIPPKEMSGAPMAIHEDDLSGLRLRLLVLIPAAMLLLGVAMWWSRRA